MTGPTADAGQTKMALAAVAVLCAAVALAILATASTTGDRSGLDRALAADSSSQSPLGR